MARCSYAFSWRLLIALLVALVVVGCSRSDAPEVSLPKKPQASSAQGPAGLRIGMGAMITPKEGYVYYNRMKEYLAKELRMPVTLVDRDNYDEMNKLLADGGVDTAFVCAGPYVDGHEQFGLQLLAMPPVNGKPV